MIPGLPPNAPKDAEQYSTTYRREYVARDGATVAPASSTAATTTQNYRFGHGRAGDRSYGTTNIGSERTPDFAEHDERRPPSPVAPALQETHMRLGNGGGAAGWTTTHGEYVDRGNGTVSSSSTRAELVKTSFLLGSHRGDYSTTASESLHATASVDRPRAASDVKELLGRSHIAFGRADSVPSGEQYVSSARHDFRPLPCAMRAATTTRGELVRSNLNLGNAAEGGDYSSSSAASAYYSPLDEPTEERAAARRANLAGGSTLDADTHTRASFTIGHGRREGVAALRGPQRRNEHVVVAPGTESAAVEASGSREQLMRTSLSLGTSATSYDTSHNDQFVEHEVRDPSEAAGSTAALQRTTLVLGSDAGPDGAGGEDDRRYVTHFQEMCAASAECATRGDGVRDSGGSIKALMKSSVRLGERPEGYVVASQARESFGRPPAADVAAAVGTRTGLNRHSLHLGRGGNTYTTTSGDAFVPRKIEVSQAASTRQALNSTCLRIGEPTLKLTYETAATTDYVDRGGASSSA